mgnify:CR=1 FL=1
MEELNIIWYNVISKKRNRERLWQNQYLMMNLNKEL